MKKVIVVLVALLIGCSVCLAGCGSNYESAVKEQFVKDCAVIGSSTLQSYGTSGQASAVPPDESDVEVTTITDGEKYKAEGDLEFRTASGTLSFHCTGTYEIDEDGNVKSVDWDVDY